MSLEVGTGKAREVDTVLGAMQRGRGDVPFFCDYFLSRKLHDGQVEFVNGAEATVNALATSNRWGKTTVLPALHFHACFYKTGGEWRYLDVDGNLDVDLFNKLRYETGHSAVEWEQASITWNEAHRLMNENERLAAFIADSPKSLPPHITFINGAKWLFRTLGVNASNWDGKSLYLFSIDEAGWAGTLEEMLNNVLRIRVADVQGRIVIAGTFKPGISKDFYKVCVRASAYTGRGIAFDHRSADDEDEDATTTQRLNSALTKYLRELGINLDEYRDAMQP